MKAFDLPSLIPALFGLTFVFVTRLNAQIAVQQFEGSPADNWTIASGMERVSPADGNADFPPHQRIRSGAHSWQISNQVDTLELTPVSTEGFTNMTVTIRLSCPATTNVQGSEPADSVAVFAALDGSAFGQVSDVTIAGSTSNNARWGFDATLTAMTTTGAHVLFASPQGGESTNNYATVLINIPDGVSTLALRILAKNNNAAELWCIDDIVLAGESGAYITQPPSPLSVFTTSFVPAIRPVEVFFSGLTDSLTASISGMASALFDVDPDTIHGSSPSPSTFTLQYSPIQTGLDSILLTFSSTGVLPRQIIVRGYCLENEPLSQPTNLGFEGVTATGLTVTFTPAIPQSDQYVVLRKAGSPAGALPSDGQYYQVGQMVGDAQIVYRGAGTTFSESSLIPSTIYYYSIFAFNGTEFSCNYLLANPLSGSVMTGSDDQIFPNLRGQELIDSLVSRYKTATVLGYDNGRNKMFGEIDNHQDSVRCVYTGDKIYVDHNSADPKGDAFAAGFNTEHTWPQSLGATGNALSDLHHLYPTRIDVNGARANYPFQNIPDPQTDVWYRLNYNTTVLPTEFIDEYSEYDNAGYFEAREDHKGNIARSMFYFYTMYKNQSDTGFFYQQKATLRLWNSFDPVDSSERSRNDRIAFYQDEKRNPFILDTSLIGRAYFETVVGLPSRRRESDRVCVILQNAPNPFNSTTRLIYHLRSHSRVSISIYNSLGQLVRRLADEVQEAGEQTVYWNGTDWSNRAVSSGVYFYVVRVEGNWQTGKVVLLK